MTEEVAVDAAETSARLGLTDAEVAERRASGRANDLPVIRSRTVRQILLANILTPFNFLLGGLLVVIIAVGPLNDALFGGVLIANALIGIVQELRAKRTLDALAVLTSPRALVVRNGVSRGSPSTRWCSTTSSSCLPATRSSSTAHPRVLGPRGRRRPDHRRVRPGRQAPRRRGALGQLRGRRVGRFQATRVGAEAYARQLAADARRFTLATSELRNGIDLIIKIISFRWSPLRRSCWSTSSASTRRLPRGARGTVAGVVAMVPEGLVLLTSVAFAVGVVRLGRRKPSCRNCRRSRPSPGSTWSASTRPEPSPAARSRSKRRAARRHRRRRIARRVAGVVAADPNPNATLRAIAEAVRQHRRGWRGRASGALLLGRKWSGGDLHRPRHLDPRCAESSSTRRSAERDDVAELGRRPLAGRDCAGHGTAGVLLSSFAEASLDREHLPAGPRPASTPACSTTRCATRPPPPWATSPTQDVTVKIISGDHPSTVAAIARRAGLTLPAMRSTAGPCRRARGAGRRDRGERPCSAASARSRSGPWSLALQARGHVVAHDRRRGQRRPGAQGRGHRHRHGLGQPGHPCRRSARPARRQLRHPALRRRRGPAGHQQHRTGRQSVPHQDRRTPCCSPSRWAWRACRSRSCRVT